jgi:hypothetical protein
LSPGFMYAVSQNPAGARRRYNGGMQAARRSSRIQ